METSLGEKLEKIKFGIVCGVFGFLIGAAGVFILMVDSHTDNTASSDPKVLPISGNPARIDKVERKGKDIQYTTSYDGAGSSIISAPVDGIPEAYAWRHKVWSTSVFYMTEGTIGFTKGYRYNDFSFSVGPWIRSPLLATPIHFHNPNWEIGAVFSVTKYSESFWW